MKLGWGWIATFAVFLASVPLLGWEHQFFGDWPNHLAMMGYVGAFLKAHAALPYVFNTTDTVGRATPLFYGHLGWPVLGFLSAVMGPRTALSLIAAGLLVLQFWSVRALVRAAVDDEAIACATAAIATWAIYPLTDLYNRAAIPEFLAITSLQAGMCLWLRYARDPARFDRSSVGAGLLVTFSLGTHPPTSLFGGITVLFLWLASLACCPDRRRMVVRSLAIGAAAALTLAPWIYLLARFRSQLKIVGDTVTLWWYPASLDAVATRLSPLPTVGRDPTGMSTPYLDAQISVPIVASLVVCGVAAAVTRQRDRQGRGALAFGAACAAMTTALLVASVSPPVWRALPKAFEIIQFPYRLVAFVNLAALAGLAGMLSALAGADRQLALARRVLALALVLGAADVGLKVPRCLASASGDVVTSYINLPHDWYFGGDDYATPAAFARAGDGRPKQAVALSVGLGQRFGMVTRQAIHLSERTLVTTNVQAFVWNALTVDGDLVGARNTVADETKLATWVEAGDHDIGYRFRPAPLWIALHFMGRVTMLIWGLAAVIWPAMAARARARIAPPDTPVAITGSG